MKIFILILLSFIGMHASAETQVFFKPDLAIIVIQGKDNDAKSLYNAMKIAPEEVSGISKKELVFSKMGEAYFSVTCNASVRSDSASCTIKISSATAVIDSENRSILMGINDRYDAPSISKKFSHYGDTYRGEVFESLNARLRIWKTFNSSGNTVSFTLQYQD